MNTPNNLQRIQNSNLNFEYLIPSILKHKDWITIGKKINACYHQGKDRTRVRLRRITNKFYDALPPDNPPPPPLSPLKTKQVIYAIFSTTGSKVYVGYTRNTAFARFQQHIREARRVQMNTHKQTSSYKLYSLIARSNYEDWRVIPLEHIPWVDERGPNSARKTFHAAARPREIFWMRRIHSFLPLGLNVDFPRSHRIRQPRPRNKNPFMFRRVIRDRVVRNPALQQLDGERNEVIVENLNVAHIQNIPLDIYNKSLRSVMHLIAHIDHNTFSQVLLDQYKSTTLRRLLDFTSRIKDNVQNRHDLNTQSLQLIFTSITSVLTRRSSPVVNPSPNRSKTILFKTPFISAIINKLNLQHIITNPQNTHLLPRVSSEIPLRTIITYHTSPTMGRRLFNYTQLLKLSSIELHDLANAPCLCNTPAFSDFIDQDHKHVVTADLNFVTNNDLRSILAKGTKFKWDSETDKTYQSIRDSLHTSITEYTISLANKYTVAIEHMQAWKHKVFEDLDTTLLDLYNKFPDIDNSFSSPLTNNIKSTIKHLQKHFVITYVDKCENDWAFICKRHYASLLLTELETNNAYAACAEMNPPISKDSILRKHWDYLSDQKLPHPAEELKDTSLPYIYGNVKAHKTPVKFRFIAGSRNSSLQPLSVAITHALRVLQPDVEKLWTDTWNSSGLNTDHSWILTDSSHVLPLIKKLNQKLRANPPPLDPPPICTYDFSTLYTNIPLDSLISRLCNLVKQLFSRKVATSRGRLTHILIDSDKSKWTRPSSEKRSATLVNADKLCEWITYLVHNTYLTLGDTIFHQVIGIPMGTNCGVFLANYFLFTYELEFITSLIIDNDIELLEKFRFTSRYIDDIVSLNNSEFDNNKHKIYPTDTLTLNLEHSGKGVPFLDLTVRLTSKNNTRFQTTIFDKRSLRKYMNLPMTKYPHVNSFTPSQHKYNIIISQGFRYLRRTMSKTAFVFYMARLIKVLKTKNYSYTKLIHKTRSFLNRHKRLFNTSSSCILRSIIARLKLFPASPSRKHLFSDPYLPNTLTL